ncbi:MAG: ChbG/HpnK family deacetylase [Candidatus Omnitrophica bacterium]|nr:ChbG/HpnK family deacetylase [Candidatus Omnitrophota bacterium]
MNEKRLIINADDLGLSMANNLAIRQCFEKNKISDTSIMSRGEAFDAAVLILKELNINNVGVHLTLTGGTMPANYFEFCKKYFSGRIRKGMIRQELDSQIKKVYDLGFAITHLDSHEHVHMLPGVLSAVIELAKKYKIPNIRMPMEPCTSIFKNFNFKDLFRYKFLKIFSYLGLMKLKKNKINHNDHFLGHFHSTRISKDIFEYLIANLKEGTTEIAFHPIISDNATELKTLMESDLSKMNIISYR